MNKLITIALILIAAIGSAQDTIIIDSTPHTKYAIVSISDYFDFNCEISEAKGYDIGMSTERVLPMDINLFTMYPKNQNRLELKAVVPIVPSNQPYCEYGLYDFNEIIFKDTTLLEYDITAKNKDWIQKHYNKVGNKNKPLKIKDK